MTDTATEMRNALRDALLLYGVAVTQTSINEGARPTISVHRLSLGAVRRIIGDLMTGMRRSHISPGAVMWSDTYTRVVCVTYTSGDLIAVEPYSGEEALMYVPAGDLRPATRREIDSASRAVLS